MSDKEARKYFENMPYGDDAKSSEIHGKHNQQVVNNMVTSLVAKYDEAMTIGDKDAASSYSGVIKQIAKDLDNLKEIKKEFAVTYGGGTGGKNMFSNWTNLQEFDIPFFLERGRIAFGKDLRPVLSVMSPDGKNEIIKRIEDITQDWVVKGTEESDFMRMQQDAVKQSNTMGVPLDFDIDWAVSNLLKNNDAWKSFATDEIGGKHFLWSYLQENEQAFNSGEIPDEALHPDSFNPEFDTRLHKHYSDRIKKAFDFNYMSDSEKREAENLMAKIKTPKKSKI